MRRLALGDTVHVIDGDLVGDRLRGIVHAQVMIVAEGRLGLLLPQRIGALRRPIDYLHACVYLLSVRARIGAGILFKRRRMYNVISSKYQ